MLPHFVFYRLPQPYISKCSALYLDRLFAKKLAISLHYNDEALQYLNSSQQKSLSSMLNKKMMFSHCYHQS